MSVNWSVSDFLARLRTDVVHAGGVRAGDIIADESPFGVARVERNGDMVELFDEDENCAIKRFDDLCTIISRSSLKEGAR